MTGRGLGEREQIAIPDYSARFRKGRRAAQAEMSEQGAARKPGASLLSFNRPQATEVLFSRATASETFGALAADWKAKRGPVSSVTEMAMVPEYQRIIGMGARALPFILEELERRPDHWFWALKAITGEDPVPSEARGNLRRMTEAWLQWGHANGTIPNRSIR
jgi:hypothetical protein